MTKSLKIKEIIPSIQELLNVGFDSSYVSIGVNKHLFKSYKICDLTPVQANILKQTALSVGTDCAVHKSVITNSVDFSDCILSGSISQIRNIAKKLKKQPFGLKLLAEDLSMLIQSDSLSISIRDKVFNFQKPLLMGILNVTPDSFSDGGCYCNVDDALHQFKKMCFEGADIVDIGGESTRPGFSPVHCDIEISRILPVLEKIRAEDSKTIISVDTRNSKTAKVVLAAGADIINDVSGLEYDKAMVDVLLEFNCPIILGHSSFGKSEISKDFDCVDSLFDYFYNKIGFLIQLGFDKSKIIIDPCLGFDKDLNQNVEIIKRIKEFKSLGCPILFGHSRKRFIKELSGSDTLDALDEMTAFVSQLILKNGANIIRVHNVEKHSALLKLSRLFF